MKFNTLLSNPARMIPRSASWTSYSNQSKNGQSRPSSPPNASQSPSIVASSLPASSRKLKSSGERSANDGIDGDVDHGADVSSQLTETRLISGNEKVGAPQVFLQRARDDPVTCRRRAGDRRLELKH